MATSAQTVSGGKLDLNTMRKSEPVERRLDAAQAQPGYMAGLVLIAFFVLVAIFAPLIAPFSPVVQSSNNSLRQPAWVQTGNARSDGQQK